MDYSTAYNLYNDPHKRYMTDNLID
jgi:hypothetical protein